MALKFRYRDYRAESESHTLPRSRTEKHPLSSSSASQQQAKTAGGCDIHFFDPLRGPDVGAVTVEDVQDTSISSVTPSQDLIKEWTSFKRILMQRFPVSRVISLSPISNAIMKGAKVVAKPTTLPHLGETYGEHISPEEAAKTISPQEYLAKVYELRDGITLAWHNEDRVTSLRLSIQVAKLLTDTTVLLFYPTVFVVVTEVLDMLGDMVWERIKHKAEIAEDDSFRASDICSEAKETCYNWFCKIGSLRELLPRIYLELAILPCWQFLIDQPIEVLDRLLMMVRGVANPLASSYCRLYMVHRMQKLISCNSGYLIKCIRDIEAVMMPILSDKETKSSHITDDKKKLFHLMEPAVEYIMRCLLVNARQENYVVNMLEDLSFERDQIESSYIFPHVSILLHHLLKELPSDLVNSQAMKILHMIKRSNDCSFSQSLNYRLLGLRLAEERSHVGTLSSVISEVIQAVSQNETLNDYLEVVDAYVDLMLQHKMENHLHSVLDDIVILARNKCVSEDEQTSLQSIFVKLLSHFKDLQEALSLNRFIEILDLMYGTSRSTVNMHLLEMGTRNGRIRDAATVQLLFDVSQSLYDATDFNIKNDDNQRQSQLISRFIEMVDFGSEMERHLTFLAECRGAFSGINEHKETLVRSSNTLATKALKAGRKHYNFVKSCIAFSEVTIPSVSSPTKQLNLYLETAEVALLGGLISHLDGLIESAVEYLEDVALIDGSRSIDMDSVASTLCKFCGLLIMVPGNPEKGVMEIPKSIFSVTCSRSWATPRLKIRIFCAIISLSSALSQDKLPYNVANPEIIGNDLLFFGDSSYKPELLSTTQLVLDKIVHTIEQESSEIVRGNMALEACNCIVSALKINEKVLQICSRLLETANVCLPTDNMFVKSTKKLLLLDSDLIITKFMTKTLGVLLEVGHYLHGKHA
ncbi:PREDICTED: UPF0505 protein [Tarenaya hassleriana]|uniref:UPF0505 protein n=1 Tax=Tarenaya hassleriana TaxID=28532 RepID=UPI00053C63B6|nr:PREDICTED: UPF0505 protein [Tarenaya hassleriana]